jgi:hypothetical protein
VGLRANSACDLLFPLFVSLTFALILFGLALLVSFAAGIWLIVIAFQRRVWWGLAVLLVPLANLVFTVVAWAEAKRPFLLSLVALPLAAGGFYLLPKDKLATLALGQHLGMPQAEESDAPEARTAPAKTVSAPNSVASPTPKDVEARLAALQKKEAGLLERKKALNPADKAGALALSNEIVAYNAELKDALADRQRLIDSGLPAVTPAAGQIAGLPFTVEKATLKDGILTLRQGSDFFADREVAIFLFLKNGESPVGRKWDIDATKNMGQPHVHLSWRDGSQTLPKTKIFMNDYRLHLEFEPGTNGAVNGRIVLTAPDERKSTVNGTFTAQVVAKK